MSKKKLHTRLDNLFADLEQDASRAPVFPDTPEAPGKPGKQSGDTGAQAPLEDLLADIPPWDAAVPAPTGDGGSSLPGGVEGESWPKAGAADKPGPLLAVPVRLPEKSVGLLEILDDDPERLWTPDEYRLVEQVADQLSLALENAYLFQREQRRANELNMLVQLSRMISENLDLEEVFQTVHRFIAQLMPTESFFINLLDRKTEEFITAYLIDKGERLPTTRFPAGVGFSGYAARTGKPYLAYDLRAEETPFPRLNYPPVPEEEEVRSAIAAPLLFSGDVIGVISTQSYLPNAFTEQDLGLLSTFADHIAIAIQNARLFEQSQKALYETETLYLASADLSTAQNYEEVLGALLRHSLVGDGSSSASILFFDRPWLEAQPPGRVDVLASWGQSADPQEKAQFPFAGYPLPASHLAADLPLLIADLGGDSRLSSELRRHYITNRQANSAAFLPIVVSGQWVGLVQAFYPEPCIFAESSLRQAAALVKQAGVALQNLRSTEIAEQRAREAQQRSEELSLINRVVTTVVSSTDLPLVMDTLAQELFQLFSLQTIDVALKSPSQQGFTIVASRTRSSDHLFDKRELTLDEYPLIRELQSSQRAALISDITRSSLGLEWKERLEKQGVLSLAAAPISAGESLLGFVAMGTSDRPFSPEDLRLAETLVIQLSTAIQNANLFEQIQTALEETENLYQASAELNRIQTYDEILSILRKYTVLGSKEIVNVTINLFERAWQKDNPPESYRPIARWALSPFAETPNLRFPLRAWGSARQILSAEEPTLIEDVAGDARMDEIMRAWYVDRLDAKSLLFAPLATGGSWIGFISAVFLQPSQIRKQEMRRLMVLASQAGAAVLNLRLLDETKRRAAQLETAAEIARDTSATLALDTLLRRAVTLIRKRYGYYHASIFLLDDSGTHASIRESTGEAGEEMKQQGHRLAVGSRSIIGYVTELGKPLVINDVSQDPIHRPNPLLPETKAELGIPLKIGSRVIGAIDVQSVEVNAFHADDIAVIQTLADQIAVAIDNARSYELAQRAVQQTEQRVQELSVLYDISQSLASVSLEPVEIAHTIAEKLLEVLDMASCTIFMLKDENGPLEIMADARKAEGEHARLGPELSELSLSAILGWKKPDLPLQPVVLHNNDRIADPALFEVVKQNMFHTLILLPLSSKGQAAGFAAIAAYRSSTYSMEQFNLAVTLANAAAVALENARLYEEQRLITDKLREVDKLKSQFLANMSHELRTPLNSIIGFSRVILKGIDGPINDLQKQDLTAIHNSGTHLLRLINNVLDISKIEAGKMELGFEDNVSLPDLVQGVISTTVALVKDKPIRLEKIISPDLPLVRCDPTRINQVMLNLMSNAAKFTEEGSITLEAGVQTGTDGMPEVLIKVTDTGEGISYEDQKKLFLPFSQVDESATRKTGGSGLGLSISRLLVEMHGGTIGLTSTPGKGSTFFFTLPLEAPPPHK